MKQPLAVLHSHGPRHRGERLALLVVVAIVASTGCSFDSSLGDARCSSDREGEYSDGRICRDGYWVNVEHDAVQTDLGDTGRPDAQPGPEVDTCVPATETCNGRDDDCDGSVDEEGVCECNYQQKTKGVCANAKLDESGTCQRPPDYNETEVRCADGKDNDCDGNIDGTDSDCECSGDDSRKCYTGPNRTEGVGICTSGTQSCRNGRWGPCENQTTPDSGEICTDQKDNDCDGAANNGCPCAFDPGAENAIDDDGTHGAGVCTGQTVAADGTCPMPSGFESRTDAESSCSGDDNDCDGATDEGCGCAFDPFEVDATDTDGSHSQGICTGQRRGADGACKRPSSFETRTDREDSCDGADNDCDGTTDEGCNCDYDGDSDGVCATAVISPGGTCAKPTTYDSTDDEDSAGRCDGLDNDCDGATDEGCTCQYKGISQGVCANASRDANGSCVAPSTFEAPTDSESSCSMDDNDCDGAVDEGCSCTFNSTSTGVCGHATRDPSGSCVAPPTYESSTSKESHCSGDDNDCDGHVDEGCPCNYNKTADGVCASATNDAKGNCQKPNDYDSTDDESGAGNCDQLDNDCDGATDEGCSCDYDGTPVGICATATRDSSGNCQKPGDYQSPETKACADGVDNDCDGTTDEATQPATASCTKDCECVSGTCSGGTCAHRVFVTGDGTTFDGDLGGLAGADSKCQTAATNAGLSGTWKAVLSDGSNDASSRLTLQASVVETDGDLVASQSDFFSSSHSEDIDLDPNANQIALCGSGCGDDHVWTGSQADGSSSGNHCSDWTSNGSSASGEVGDAEFTNGDWAQQTTESCDGSYHLYCIDGQ